jgi:hypothetical protein
MTQQNNTARIVMNQRFDPKGHTDENTLAAARLTQPDKINQVITHLQGKDSDMFPLTFMTEGQKNGTQKITVNDIQYEWDIAGELDTFDIVVTSNYSPDSVAQHEAVITMKTNWLKYQHTVVAEDGTRLRVNAQPVKTTGGYIYKLACTGLNDTIPTNILQRGSKFSMEGPGIVSESSSFGNESNVVLPGKMKNQISVLRKSYHFAGNISNKVVECHLPTKSGGVTKLWMPYEEWQHEMTWKKHVEEHNFYSQYNRNANGVITKIDPDTGLPIPEGAGLVNQLPNRDTYSFLTAEKLDKTVLSVMYGNKNGVGNKTIILYTGIGGAREFDRALKAKTGGINQIIGDKFISGTGANLVYGGYFNAYETKEGNRIIVKLLNILDYGSRAKVSPKHPIDGLPLTSYNMYYVDHTIYDNVPNVRLVHQQGRSFIRGIEQGMALVKGSTFGDYNGNSKTLNLSTSQDKTSIHMLATTGVVINNNTHCFFLEPDISIGV